MTTTDVEVQVVDQPELNVEVHMTDPDVLDVGVQLAAPTFTVVSMLPTGPRGPEGPEGPEGPAGPPGEVGGAYTHSQGATATTWTIVHNLGYRPNVQPVDTLDRWMVGDVQHVDANTLTVTFAVAVSGKAYLS